MIVVITSFEKEPMTVSLPLDELQLPIHHLCKNNGQESSIDGSETLSGLWNVTHLRDSSTCMVGI